MTRDAVAAVVLIFALAAIVAPWYTLTQRACLLGMAALGAYALTREQAS
jgi:hypothetical protein